MGGHSTWDPRRHHYERVRRPAFRGGSGETLSTGQTLTACWVQLRPGSKETRMWDSHNSRFSACVDLRPSHIAWDVVLLWLYFKNMYAIPKGGILHIVWNNLCNIFFLFIIIVSCGGIASFRIAYCPGTPSIYIILWADQFWNTLSFSADFFHV